MPTILSQLTLYWWALRVSIAYRQSQVRLVHVHKRGGLHRLSRLLACETRMGERAEFVTDQRQQRLGSPRASTRPFLRARQKFR